MNKREQDAKGKRASRDDPVDLAARIGRRSPSEAASPSETAAPEGADPKAPLPQRLDGPLPARRSERPSFIRMDEPAPPTPAPDPKAAIASALTPSIQDEQDEIDLVVTPLPTPDDWHRFEIELRRVRGITQLRPEFYRHGVAKMRVVWEGEGRLAQVLRAGIPGYHVRILGEDRNTLQILVSSDNEERRPG